MSDVAGVTCHHRWRWHLGTWLSQSVSGCGWQGSLGVEFWCVVDYGATKGVSVIYQIRSRMICVWYVAKICGTYQPARKIRTTRRPYRVDPVEAIAIVFRRLATPSRWVDLHPEFGNHTASLSQLFYDALAFLNKACLHRGTGRCVWFLYAQHTTRDMVLRKYLLYQILSVLLMALQYISRGRREAVNMQHIVLKSAENISNFKKYRPQTVWFFITRSYRRKHDIMWNMWGL
jgi:hypothetical protein